MGAADFMEAIKMAVPALVAFAVVWGATRATQKHLIKTQAEHGTALAEVKGLVQAFLVGQTRQEEKLIAHAQLDDQRFSAMSDRIGRLESGRE